MRMTLQPDQADLAPGDEAEFHVAMANDGADDVEVELELQGLDADLWTLANPIPVIPAGQVGRTTIRVRLPEDATPGERRISVSVRDATGTVGASAAAALRVGSNDVIAIETDPASVAGKKGAKLDTIVRNRGDETLRLRVSGQSDGASVTIRPAEFDLPPGKGARLKARIERNERSWFKERRHGLVLDVRGGTVPATTSAIFVQKPIVPPVLLRSLAVLVALAVWASATFVLFSRMSANDEVAAPVAPTETLDPNAPPPPVLLAGDVPIEDDGTVAPPLVITGTVEGPRDLAGTAVTIERVSFGDEGTTDGSTGKVAPLTPVAVTSGTVLDKITATTDERGRFRVASGLVMGAFYRVTAQRSGFDLRSQVVAITEETPEIELAMSLVPGRGVMSGRIVDTEGNPVGGATIAATQGSITYRTTTASTGDAVGSWSLEGLATPSTYLITVAAVGYASQQLTVEVGGGATVAGVDAELTRDRGTIRGRITYRDAGVGAVTVALEGEVSRTTTTLTIGDLKGSFDFPNLPYGTYLLTFSAPGWLTSSREVTVTTGDVPVDVKDLLPSTAIVQGVVAQQVVDGGCDYPDPTAAAAEIGAGSCGGVGVSVIGENGVWSTTTATGDGSFRISGVPAGEYTVRFERYGYLPEFYKVVIGPGDVITLPDDATYDVEMAAYVGPRNRVLEPLSTESVQLRLVPATALDAGRVTGIVRDVERPNTDFDAAFPDWSGGCRDERIDVVVRGQSDVVCVLSAGGGFELLGVAAGAADLVVNAPGFGTYTTTIQVAPEGETQAGLIALTPLASLILNVTGTGDVPVQDAVVFVAPTDPTVPVFKGEADVRECTVTRADANDLWRERVTVPDGHQSKVGLCGDADSAGDVSFARGLGTGSFDVILPVNGADPTDPAVLAGTVPMDHRQLSRSIDVQVGESARLDLRLRRYASIVGTIQVPNATGTGYTNLTALDGLGAFPAMGVYPNDPTNPPGEEGIEFCEIDANDVCVPYDPTYVTPRVSFGSAAGLAAGQFRINRIPPNEGTLLREYRIRIETDEGSFERSPSAGGGIEGLAFGEERTLSAVASPGPTDIEIDVVWNDGSGTLQPVPDAVLRVTGTAGYRTIDVAPFREEIVLTCPSTACVDGQTTDDGFTFAMTPDSTVDATGVTGYGTADGLYARLDDPATSAAENRLRIDEVYRVGTLTLEAVAPGFDLRQGDVQLRSVGVGDGYEFELVPAAKRVTGSVSFSPSAPSDEVIGALTATLTPSAGGASVSTAVVADGAGGGTYTFTSARPGSYILRISGSGVFAASSTQVITPSAATTATIPAITMNRTVDLQVTVEECAPAVSVDCSTATFVVVPGATVLLQSSTDGGTSWTTVGTSTSCTDANAADCAGLGIATFSGLVASSGTTYRVVIPLAPKAGYRRVEGTTGVFSVGSLSSASNPSTVRVEQFGSVTGVVRGKLSAGDSDATAPRLAGVTVQLKSGSTVVGTAITDGSGSYTLPATLRADDGDYTVVIPQLGVTAPTNYQAQGTPPTVTLDGPGIEEVADIVVTASPVTVTGTVVDPLTSPGTPLANVRVSVVGGDACDATPDPSDAGDPCEWTDALGTFSISVAPRSTTLKFEEFSNASGSWQPTTRPVLERNVVPSVGQGLSGLTIEKPPALGDMTGRIQRRDHTGAAPTNVSGATVEAFLTSAPNVKVDEKTSGDDGSFTFDDLGVGSYNLRVTLAGYAGAAYEGVLVVANGSSTVPTIVLNANSRPVRIKATSGGAALRGITIAANPPSGSSGLSVVSGTTDASGLVDLALVPGTWTLSTTNGAGGTLTVGGQSVTDHIDAADVGVTVTFAADGSVQDTSGSPLIEFVAVTGEVTGNNSSGTSTGALGGATVSLTTGTASTTTASGTGSWTLWAPVAATPRTLSFTVERIGYTDGSTSASVGSSSASATAVALQALPGQQVTFDLVSSSDGNDVTGASVVVTQGSDSLTVADGDDGTVDGSVVFSSLAAGDYVVSLLDADADGRADGATDHLAFGPLNPVTGADLGTGPRSITVDANTGAVTVVLQKLDTALTGSVGTVDVNEALQTLDGTTISATWSSGGRTATVRAVLSSASAFTGSDIAVASDRPWTVTIDPPASGAYSSYVAATRSIATGGSGSLGRITLASSERTVVGTITGPAGRTVTITASANGYADRVISQSVAIDSGDVRYSLAGLSNDVTWQLDFAVAGTTVSRWVGPGSGDVTLDQAVGADAVAVMRVVVIDTTETAARTTPLTVTLRLDENTTPGSSTTTTAVPLESIGGGSTTATVTLVPGQTSAEHTFANLVKASATTNGLLPGRFSIQATPGSGFAVDTGASSTLTGLDPSGQTLVVEVDPSTRAMTATLLDGRGTTADDSDDLALGDRTVTLTRTIAGAVNTITGTADGSTTNLYTFTGVLPGTWTLDTPGFAGVPVLVPTGTSSHGAGTFRLLSSTDRLDASTVSTASSSLAVSGTTTVTVQLIDGSGVNLSRSGGRVRLFTDHGSLSAVNDPNTGSYTATFTAPTEIGSATISASLDGRMLSDTAEISVVAGAADAGESTISVDRATLPADGTATGTVRVRLADEFGNPIRTGGATVAITESSSQIELTGSVTDNNDGSYSRQYRATTTAGTATISVTVGGSAAGSVSVSTTAVDDQVRHSTVTAAAGTVTAGGTVGITVRLRSDASTDLVSSGRAVVLRAASGTIGSVSEPDPADGSYTATYTPPTTAGEYVIWATLDGRALSAVARVTVVAGAVSAAESTVSLDRFAVAADGASTATVTAMLRDQYGNPLSSSSDTVSASLTGGGSISAVPTSGATRDITFTTDRTFGTSVITVSVGSPAATIDSVAISRTPVSEITGFSTVRAGSATATAGDTSPRTISVQMRNASGVVGSDLGTVTIRSSAGSVGATSYSTDGAYTASFIPPTTAGPVVVWATLNGLALSDSETVTVVPAAASTATSLVTAAASSLAADGSTTTTITVALRDRYSNYLSATGGTVTMTVASGSGTLSSVTDGSDGTYSATYTAGSVSGIVQIEAAIGGSLIDDVALITLGAQTATAADSTIEVSDTVFVADGSSTVTVIVQPRDANQNAVISGSHTIVVTATAGTVASSGSPTRRADGSYAVTLTAPTTAGVITITATLGGSAIADSATVRAVAGAASTSTSTVTVADSSLPPDGSSTTTVTVRARDANSNPLTASAGTVVVSVTGGGSVGGVTDNRDGTYTATYTAGSSTGTATISATLGGSAVTDTATVSLTATVPTAPVLLSAAAGNGQVVLDWAAPSSTGGSAITDYVIEQSTDGGSTWSTVSDGTSTSTAATVSSLTNGTAYRFRIAAENSVGTGASSNQLSATPRTVPDSPTGLTVSSSTASSVTIGWSAPSSTGGSAITGYIVEYRPGSTGAFATLSTQTADTRSVTVVGLSDGTTYEFRVAAVNAAGQSAFTAAVSGSTSATTTP